MDNHNYVLENIELYSLATVGAAVGAWKYYVRPELTLGKVVWAGAAVVALLGTKLIQESLKLQD